MPRPSSPLFHICLLGVWLWLCLSLANLHAEPPPDIYTEAPANVFFQGTGPVIHAPATLQGSHYVLKNWCGEPLLEGEWPASGSPLRLPILPNGYYLLHWNQLGQTQNGIFNFTIIPEPHTRKYPQESFFGIDSAQSWLASPGHFQCRWYEGDTYRLVSDLIAWAGFPHVRERLSWREVNPVSGEFHYGRYLQNAELLHERGLRVSGMFHDAPDWTDNAHSLPCDLVALFRASRQFAQDFGERMEDWEFWNEQDIDFSKAPVWDYAAALKAASLGFKAGRKEIIVAPGALCAGANTAFHQCMYANDVGKYTDVLNYHIYAPPAEYAFLDTELHQFLEANHLPGRAIWLTECGTRQEGLTDLPGVMPQYKAHSPEQEMLQAEFYPKSQIYHWMQGVARNYFFVFPPYNEIEGRKDWGVMRRDGSVKPIYAAMSTMLAHLVEARLLGEIQLQKNLRAFLFAQPDQTQTLVFWQPSKIDSQPDPTAPESFTLEIPSGEYLLTDMLGTPKPLTVQDNKTHLTATRYPAYLSGLHGLKPDLLPRAAGVIDNHPASTKNEDLTVVLRAELSPEDFTITNRKAVAELQKELGHLKVVAWNLSEVPKTGFIRVAGGELEGLPAEIPLPPMGKFEADVLFRPETPKQGYETHLVLDGIFNGQNATKLDIPIRSLNLLLARCQITPLDWLKPSSWERNTSANLYECDFDPDEKALRFEAAWTEPADRWFYPVHHLDDKEQRLWQRLIGLQFEVKSLQDKVENDFRVVLVMIGYSTPEDATVRTAQYAYPAPMTSWETRRVFFDQTLPEDATVHFVRIGCNPIGTKLTYWLKNLTLLREN